MEIKFCENNLAHGSEALALKLKKEFKDINIEVEACLGYCGECAERPFAVVGEEMITATTSDELYGEIVKRLN